MEANKNWRNKNNHTGLKIIIVGIIAIVGVLFIAPQNKRERYLWEIKAALHMGEKVNKNVSMFSWYYELMDSQQFQEHLKNLRELKVTRIYQIMSADLLSDSNLHMMIANLQEQEIDTVLLTGDKSWVEDGLAEYKQVVDAVEVYNNSVNEEVKIKVIALDVEVHSLPGFWEESTKLFSKYIDVMREAKEYAASHELKVIQIVPTFYEEVDKELFDTFVLECCDELSIMNYDRRYAKEAIQYEVEFCRQHEIPIETIFETMPLSKEHQVTEDLTYYYDGLEILQSDFRKLQKVYGKELGMAYHHYSILREII